MASSEQDCGADWGHAGRKTTATPTSHPTSPFPSHTVGLAPELGFPCGADQREGWTGPLPHPKNRPSEATPVVVALMMGSDVG